MWKAVSTHRDTADSAFVSWRVMAENNDGRERIVMVKIETLAAAATSWTTPKGVLRHVRDVMETRGRSVIEHRRLRMDLPPSFLYRRGFGGFIEE